MKITGFDNIERFRKFNLNKESGNHSTCSFSFVASEYDDYSSMIGKEVKVIDEYRDLCNGIVSGIQFSGNDVEDMITVDIHSVSVQMDEEKNFRVFQKENQTYKEIIDEIISLYEMKIEIPVTYDEMKLEYPIIQLMETDYMFLKRMIKEAYGTKLITDVSSEKNIYCGHDEHSNYQLMRDEVYEFHLSMDKKNRALEFTIRGDDLGQELRQYVNVGKKIVWKGVTYIIESLSVKLIDSVYRYICKGIEKNNIVPKQKEVGDNLLLTAKVAEVADPEHYGRIRLDFNNELVKDMTSEKRMWVHVLTPYTAEEGGFVFIPEIGDVVQVLWDGKAFVCLGCIRQKPLSEKYQDVELKQIGNLYGKNICFDKERLVINSDESKIELSDEEVKISVKQSNVVLTEKLIEIETEKSKMSINDDICIDTAKLHVDANEKENNIKGNYTCEGKNITINAAAIAKIEGKIKVDIN